MSQSKEIPVPPVESLGQGVWSIPMPLLGPLRYVIAYVVETPGGLVLIDAGWNSDESWQRLTDGLTSFGASIGDLEGVLVTHAHPDHYGMAPRVSQESGAWVAMHPADLHMLAGADDDVEAEVRRIATWLTSMGAPRADVDKLYGHHAYFSRVMRLAPPDVLLEDGERVAHNSMTVVHTPGHTDGHVCFHDSTRELLFGGDHVLAKITPNISSFTSRTGDPLGNYLGSLTRVRELPVHQVYPAHVHRIADLNARVDELLAHHEQRLAEIADAVKLGAETTWDIAAQQQWKRGWDGLDAGLRRMALAETDAHLITLAGRGVITRHPTADPYRWLPASA